MRLRDLSVLIMGAGSGIGAATLELALAEGARVVAADVSTSIDGVAAAALRAHGGQCVSAVADVSSAEDCLRVVRLSESTYGRLDGVVDCAGASASGTATTMSDDDWDRVMAVNLKGAFHLGRAAVPALARSGGGSIVFVSSQLGLVGGRNSVAYTASKAGLINLARSMALDHADAQIRVNSVCPGPVQTEFLERSLGRQTDPDAARTDLLSRVPLRRFGTAMEIATGIIYLISRESSYVTGTALVIDGGVLAQ